ncbi:MAG: TPR repeat protein [Methylophagaceae bacterium]|jgi:TPR repeat protein
MNKFILILLTSLLSVSKAHACSDKALSPQQNYANCKHHAEQGMSDAQYDLGLLYQLGSGVKQDYKQTFYWWSKAAKQGDARAQLRLGYMYIQGYGVSQDYVMSHMWFNLSNLNGDKEAAKNREVVAGRMIQSDISKAQNLAREWMSKYSKK